MVGAPGSNGERFAPAAASSLNLPSLMCGRSELAAPIQTGMRPGRRSLIASDAP
jgi:hypothetical protein